MSARLSVVALLLALFVLDAVAVALGWTAGFDRAVLAALRQAGQDRTAIGPAALVPAAIAITELGAGVGRLPATLLGGLILLLARRGRDAAVLVAGVASGAIALPLLKLFFHRARPDAIWQIVAETRPSFPSGHAMGSMLLYPLAGWLIGRLAGVGRVGVLAGVAVALLVGMTRVFLGVHWTSDVIGGWLIGGAWAVAAGRFAGAGAVRTAPGVAREGA